MERVLTSAEVKDLIGDIAVGLAADCDAPESGVEEIMKANLAGARMLPFVGFISHDGKWVDGFAGYKDAGGFLKVLEVADKSPLLDATDAVRKKVAALARTAERAAEKGDWKAVLKASRDAGKTVGRCPERAILAALVKQAREWATGQFDAIVKDAQSGGDLAELRKTLGVVKTQFFGEPEAAEADIGLKALQKLSDVVAAESREAPPDGVREKAASAYKGTRWEKMFEKAPPVPAAPPAEGEE